MHSFSLQQACSDPRLQRTPIESRRTVSRRRRSCMMSVELANPCSSLSLFNSICAAVYCVLRVTIDTGTPTSENGASENQLPASWVSAPRRAPETTRKSLARQAPHRLTYPHGPVHSRAGPSLTGRFLKPASRVGKATSMSILSSSSTFHWTTSPCSRLFQSRWVPLPVNVGGTASRRQTRI